MADDDSTKVSDSMGDARLIRIVLVEDHVILRDGLRSLLDMEDELSVVGEAESCDKGLEVIKTVKPDLVLTDIGLQGRSGLTLIPEIKQLDDSIRVLVLTAHCTDEYVRAALESGADGYVLKDSSRLELIAGIRTVMDGQQYLSTEVTNRVVSGFLGNSTEGEEHGESKITPRESEVLTLIASAYSTKEIANRLSLSVKTVEKHRSNLMRKLGLRSAAAVTLYAVRNNYLSADLDIPKKGGS